jgi:hypothetical protein
MGRTDRTDWLGRTGQSPSSYRGLSAVRSVEATGSEIDAVAVRLEAGGGQSRREGRSLVTVWAHPRLAVFAAARLLTQDAGGLGIGVVAVGEGDGTERTELDSLEAQRLSRAAAPGTAVISERAWLLAGAELPEGVTASAGEFFIGRLGEPDAVVILRALGSSELPLRNVETLPNNLPGATIPFVGRRAELSALVRDPDKWRVATLVGPPGVGKTRLALRARLSR